MESSVERLVEGNRRFAEGHPIHPGRDSARRAEVRDGQAPFAVIVGCSDSRVPPEILFDQGLGDLFVVRAAGNILDDIGMASVAYAVQHLGVRLVIVLGHSRCGAVGAALDGAKPGGRLDSIVEALEPAVSAVRGRATDEHGAASRMNVHAAVVRLERDESLLRNLAANGELEIIGAYYDIDTGKVELPIVKGDIA